MSFRKVFALVCSVVMLCTCTDALATAALLFPASLEEIEAGAFQGDLSVRGLISLPSKVKTVGDYAFAGTNAYALALPTSVRRVGHQIGSGLIYVKANSQYTVFQTDSLEGVRYAFGNSAGNMAQAGAGTFYPVSSIKSSGGFYYHVASGEAELLCAVDPDSVGDSVRIPETVSNTPVTSVAEDAFAGCERLDMIYLPSTAHPAAGAFSGCPDAVVQYYGSGFVVEYIESSVVSAAVGDTVQWVARASAANAAYRFDLYDLGSDIAWQEGETYTLVSSAEASSRNHVSLQMNRAGTFVMIVTCTAPDGSEAMRVSVPVTVSAGPVRAVSITPEDITLISGSSCTWTAAFEDGNGAKTCSFVMTCGETVIASSNSTELTAENLAAGEYTLTFTVTDADGNESSITAACSVVSESAFSPAAPELTSGNLAATEAEAPAFESAELEITWAAVPEAQTYGVILERQEGDIWAQVFSRDKLTDLRYAFSQSLLNVEETTIFRIGLYSQQLGDGEPAWYFINVQPVYVDSQIYLDDSAAVTWNQSAAVAGSRVFTVASAYDWTFVSDSEWIDVKRSGDTLTVSMDANADTANRTAAVTLDNGLTTAVLTINQGYVLIAPEITWPVMSEDPENPTTVGTGILSYEWEKNNANRVLIQISKKVAGQWVYQFMVRSSGTKYSFANSASRKLVSGETYRIRVAAIWDDAYATNEQESMRLYQDYYVNASESANMILVNNASSATAPMTGSSMRSEDLNIYATSTYTVSGDVDWLSLSDAPSYGFNQVCVFADANMADTTRTGHLTLTCENVSATITVTQPSMMPRIALPALSTNASSPTSVPKNDLNIVAYGTALVIEKLSGGSYVATDLTVTRESFDRLTLRVYSEDLSTSTTYRATVSYGESSISYYFKTSSSSTSYVYVNGTGTGSWNTSAAAATKTITVSASGSWTAVSDSAWLTLSKASGSSTSGTDVTVSAAANDTELTRTGMITFKRGSYYTAYYIVTQTPAMLNAAFEDNGTTSIEVPGSAGAYHVDLSHTGKATMTSQNDWISPSSGTTSSVSFRLNVTKNETGAVRTGSLTVTEDGNTVTLYVTQKPSIASPSLLSPSIGVSNSSSPTMLPNGPLTLSWQAVQAAVSYKVTLWQSSPSRIVWNRTVMNDTTTVSVPDGILEVGVTYHVYIRSYDEYGGSYNEGGHYFILTDPDTLYINKTKAAVWDGADDYGDEASFTVLSPGTWQAASSAAWLTLGAASGASGDKLTVTAQENLGAARTGTVSVTCGSATATLTVHQCAYLGEEFQPIISPELSEVVSNPTILPSGTDSITVAWNALPQADYYQVKLRQVKSAGSTVGITSSGLLRDGIDSYTFSNLSLESGILYCVQLFRNCARWGTTAMYYYFTVSNDAACLEIDEEEIWLNGDNDSDVIYVTANGAWYASTDADWIGLSRNPLYDIEEYGDYIIDYSDYVGSAEQNWVTVTPTINNTGNARTAIVTLRCGNIEKQVTVHQSVNYTCAELTNLNLSRKSSQPTSIAMGDLFLRWSESVGGTGLYEVTLKKDVGYRYEKVWSRELNSLSTTIPASCLEEGATYLLFLGTEAVDEDEIYGNRYFFTVRYANELGLNLSVDWSQIAVNGYVNINAYASGGSGTGYTYAYELLHNGVKVRESTWIALDRYNFQVTEAGTYCVHAYLKDSSGTIVTADSAPSAVSAEDTARVTLDLYMWNAPAEGGTQTVGVEANNSWSASSSDTWLTASGLSDQILQLKAADNLTSDARTAVVTVTCGKASRTITVTQQGTQSSGTVTLSESTWMLGTVFAEEKVIIVTSTDDWSVVAATVPAWLRLTAMSGQSGEALGLLCMANSGATRSAAIVIASGNSTATLTVTQPGTSDSAQVLSATLNGLTLVGIPTYFRINTKNADSVAFLVDGAIEGTPVTVTNGIRQISHTFERGGDHLVQIIPYRDGAMGAPYDMGTVNIRYFGDLNAPELNYNRTMLQGASQILSWGVVTGAEQYAVKVNFGSSTVYTEILPAGTLQKELTPDILPDIGTYTIEVRAMAYGYNTASSAAVITTRMPQINFSITSPKHGDAYIKGDLMDIQVSNPDGYHIAIKVTPENPDDPVEWLPADGSTCSDTVITQTFYFRPKSTQTYTFEAMAWATETRNTEARAWHDSSRQVQISINGPTFRSARINSSTAGVRLQSDVSELTVRTNNAVNSVSVFLDNSTQPLETKSGEGSYEQDASYTRTWQFDLSVPSANSYHTYKVTATDGEKEINTALGFYCVEDCDFADVYSKTNGLQVMKYPTGSSSVAGTIDMMQKCTLMGTYGSYSYISCSEFSGFVPSTALSEQIVYDTDKFELGFIEDTSDGPKTVYSYVGASNIRISWHSNKDSFNPDLVYMITLHRAGGIEWKYERKDIRADFAPTASGTYTVSIALKDKVKNETVKTAESQTTYVIYQNLTEYIKEQDETQLKIIEIASRSFESSLKMFEDIHVNRTADNPFVKGYQLIDMKFGTLAEFEGSKAADIAESILCNLAANVPDSQQIDADIVTNILSLIGIPADIIDVLSDYSIWTRTDTKRVYEAVRAKLLKNGAKLKNRVDKIAAKNTGDVLTSATILINLAVSIFNAVVIVNKFAAVPNEQIEMIINQYRQSKNPLLTAVADKLDQFRTKNGRIAYAAGKVTWATIEQAIELGKSIAIEAMKKLTFGSVLLGLSIGTAIGDSVLNAGDVAETATKAKWAVEAVSGYTSRFTEARDAFLEKPNAENYRVFASTAIACQQLILNAYTKMFDFYKAVDDGVGIGGSADYQSIRTGGIGFEANSNTLLEELNKFWAAMLSDQCEQIKLTPASTFTGSN